MANKKSEDLQSRREFFKSAAKAALPVIGAVVLSSLPLVKSKAATSCYGGGCMYDCDYSCQGGCAGACKGDCYTACARGCSNSCTGASYW